MANRFNFVSPGAAAGEGIQDFLMRRELQRRAMVQEDEQAENLKLRQGQDARAGEADARAALVAEDQRAAAEISRRAAEAALARGERTDAMADLEQAGVGGELTGEAAERAKRLIPGMVQTLPGEVTQGAQIAVDDQDIPTYETATGPEKTVSKGTKRQQILKGMKDDPSMSVRDIALGLIDASGDDNIPAGMAALLANEDTTVPIFRRSAKGDVEMLDGEGKWTPHKGEMPKDAKFINEPTAGGMGGGMAVRQYQDDNGTHIVTVGPDGSINDVVVGGLRPFAGQAQSITRGQSALVQADTVRNMIDPEWVGPLAGRFNSIATAYTETMGPQGYAFFESQVNGLKNAAIKAITGAQMSEAEATRIMKELPDVNLPPATFLARLDSFMQQIEIATTIEQMYATGRKNEAFELRVKNFGANDAAAAGTTEDRLQKLFPNVKLKVNGGQGSGGRAGGANTTLPGVVATTPGGEWETKNGVKVRKVAR